MKKIVEKQDTDYSLVKVPKEMQMQGLFASMMVLVGFTFFTPSMTAGGQLGISMNLTRFLLSMLLGNAFLGLYCAVLSYIGQKTGFNIDVLGSYSFGKRGSLLSSVIISFTQIGWFGVGVAMFAIPVSMLFNIPMYVLIFITGFFMTITAYLGISAIAILGSIAVPLIAILGIYSVNFGINQVGGIMNVFSNSQNEYMSLATGISIVVGSFISGGTSTPNFSRFAKTPIIAIISTVVAFFIGNSIMMIFGAVGGAVTGKPDIFDILILQGLAIPAVITLGLNIWTTNNNALYTAGLGVANITKKEMKSMIIFIGLIGTVMSVWLYNNFVVYLTFLSAIIPPIGVVIMLHYFMYKSNYYDENYKKDDINIYSIISVIIGATAGFVIKIGVQPINALIFTAIPFLIFEGIKKIRNKNN